MNMNYIDRLQKAMLAEDEIATEDTLSAIEDEDYSIDYADAILRFMENNPNLDYGMPGPAVRFAEKFFLKGYETLLLESIKRTPTVHTLWMLNRIINSPKLAGRDEYLDALKGVVDRDDISDEVRQEAIMFLEYQEEK